MREGIHIKTPDEMIIYGTLDSADNNNLIIFVHGFTGNKDEHHYINAVPYFLQNGNDTFRFNLYARADDARSLSECSISTHVNDLHIVIDHFKGKYDNIHIVGHSLGCLPILQADLTPVSKIVLWDPTTGFRDVGEKRGTFNPDLDAYIFKWALDFIVSKRMVEEWMSFDVKKAVEGLSVPCKFIFAGGYNKHELWRPHLNEIPVLYDSTIIDGATHCFVEEGGEQRLFEETLKWFLH